MKWLSLIQSIYFSVFVKVAGITCCSAEALSLATTLFNISVLFNDLQAFVGLGPILDHDFLEKIFRARMSANESPLEYVKIDSFVFNLARHK